LGPLTPGQTSLRTLAHADEELVLPTGAGAEARFVFIDGRCVDQRTAASVPLGTFAPGTCPDDLERFIAGIAQSLISSAGASGTGRASHQ
jgi:hypothetical protein